MHVYSLPLRTTFRGLQRRTGVVWSGPYGWAEFSPFEEYDDHEALSWLQAAYEAANLPPVPVLRNRIPVNVTVPATTAERAHHIVTSSQGCTTAKVKVAEPGQSLGQEIERLEAVRDALGPAGHIRVDANGAWDVDTAAARLTVLNRAAGGLQYAEQPCPTVPELAQLRRRMSVPIAADESIRRAEDPYQVIAQDAADILVLKVQPLGGVRACLRLAEELGKPVVVSSALESSVGLRQGLHLAAALPELPYACGLATAQLFTTDTIDPPLLPVNGHITLTDTAPTPATLTASAASPDTTHWWEQRITRVQQLLGSAQPPTAHTGGR
ncbi:o-succinylbenzoate synthase [Jonesia quinghaiensis]|uniref:o-succinylbenzoate synthase n=1 Tax=Jonesia quinghaiensis TaxID=262806 RepID=UPI0004109737|nr:o-succinylbenzoate synthase [Jonesia quinghaiensis]